MDNFLGTYFANINSNRTTQKPRRIQDIPEVSDNILGFLNKVSSIFFKKISFTDLGAEERKILSSILSVIERSQIYEIVDSDDLEISSFIKVLPKAFELYRKTTIPSEGSLKFFAGSLYDSLIRAEFTYMRSCLLFLKEFEEYSPDVVWSFYQSLNLNFFDEGWMGQKLILKN